MNIVPRIIPRCRGVSWCCGHVASRFFSGNFSNYYREKLRISFLYAVFLFFFFKRGIKFADNFTDKGKAKEKGIRSIIHGISLSKQMEFPIYVKLRVKLRALKKNINFLLKNGCFEFLSIIEVYRRRFN